jgi:hypothetical protein
MTDSALSERFMDDDEQALAFAVYDAIQQTSTYSERSQQSADFRIGISDLGYCSEKVRRMLAGIPEPPTDKLPAFLGTAIGDHVEQAVVAKLWPTAIRQATVTLDLTGESGRNYTLTGHPDLIEPSGILLDVKTSRGLSVAERNGPSQQQQFQRHCYALGAWLAGLFDPGVTLDDVRVANVWVDRGGDERRAHCHMEPYSPDVVTQAGFWVDDLVYAYLHGETARKEPAIPVCQATCGHFRDCRAYEALTASGLIDDPDVVTAAQVYRDALDLERQAAQMKDEAKSALTGVEGSTGKFHIRWIHVNGGHVEFDRKASDRLEVRPI